MMKTLIKLLPAKITVATPNYGIATIELHDEEAKEAAKEEKKAEDALAMLGLEC